MNQLPVALDVRSQFLERARVLGHRRGQKVQRDILAQHFVMGEPDFRSIAGAQAP